MTYRELGGPKESAFAGFLRLFADPDFVRKLTHFRKRLQNKEKNDPSRIEGFRSHYPFKKRKGTFSLQTVAYVVMDVM